MSAVRRRATDPDAPVRRGSVYCGCGLGCTFAEYGLACSRGLALARSLGPGWTHRVWDNLGWHYAVYLADDIGVRCEIHCSHHGLHEPAYTAFVHKTFVATHADPRKALVSALELARSEADAIRDVYSAVKDATTKASRLMTPVKMLKEKG